MEQPKRHPFLYRDFRFYWVARLSGTLAQMSMVIVIGWEVYDIARQTLPLREASLLLGYIGLCQFIPLAALTLVTGWVADRVDRRLVARLALGLEAGCAGVLAYTSTAGITTLTHLFSVAILLGVARAFAGPALQGLAPNLVPRPVLPTAIAMSSISWQVGSIAGPAVGGILYASGSRVPYLFAATLFTVALLCLSAVRPVPRKAMAHAGRPWRQMIDGLRYVRQNRLVLGAMSLDLFAVLLGGATAMLPVFARDVLHVGASGLGQLRAAPAVGAACVAIWFSVHPLTSQVGVKMLVSVALFGLGTVGFGYSESMPLSLCWLAFLGAADMLSVYVRQSLIQLHTPDEMRGRVGAVSSLFISGSNELGEAESGLAASFIGPVNAVVFGGIGAIGVTALWAFMFPELRRARTFSAPIDDDEGESP